MTTVVAENPASEVSASERSVWGDYCRSSGQFFDLAIE
jgi:hypothetical protein